MLVTSAMPSSSARLAFAGTDLLPLSARSLKADVEMNMVLLHL